MASSYDPRMGGDRLVDCADIPLDQAISLSKHGRTVVAAQAELAKLGKFIPPGQVVYTSARETSLNTTEAHLRYLGPTSPDEAFEVMENWHAGTYSDQALRVELSNELAREFPTSNKTDQGAWEAPYCPGGWDKNRTIPGVGQLPHGQRAPRQESYNDQRSSTKQVKVVAFEADEEDIPWLRQQIKLTMVKGQPVAVSWNRYSSSGEPFFSKVVAEKSLMYTPAFSADALGRIFHLVRQKSLLKLYREFSMLFLSTAAWRHQADAFDKRRLVYSGADWVMANDSLVGRPEVAQIPGLTEFLRASRTRPFDIVPGIVAAPLVPLIASVRDAKHLVTVVHDVTTPVAMAEWLNQWPGSFIHISDCSNHDQKMVRNVLREICWRYGELSVKEAGEYAMWMSTMPSLVKDDHPGGSKHVIHGNPMDLSTFYERGNNSGSPFTDETAKQGGLFYAFKALRMIGLVITFEHMEMVLRDAHPLVRLRAMGDNVVAQFKRKSDRDAYALAGIEMKYNGFEETPTFCGMCIGVTAGGLFHVEPSIIASVERTMVPARDLDDPQRGKPAVGNKVRQLVYSACHLYPRVRRVFFDLVLKWQGIDLYTLSEPTAEVLAMNWADLLYINNPDTLNYLITLAMLSPALQQEARFSISANTIEYDMKRIGYW